MSDKLKETLMKIHELGADKVDEFYEILKYYAFFQGKAKNAGAEESEIYKGQSWRTPEGLDFTPTKDIRNHCKKLILKQGRFMMGVAPSLVVSAFNDADKDKAEDLRQLIDYILEDTEFWSEAYKAFIDSTIGKRCLLVIMATQERIIPRFYRADMFTYKTNPDDVRELQEVIVAYQDESTIGFNQDAQIWYKYKYFKENTRVYLEITQMNGAGDVLSTKSEVLPVESIPCRVILNGGLLGDGEGQSDVAELMDMANTYNRTLSDYRDALKFRMFEQMVFTDADEASLDSVQIAPNALIDLRSDPANKDKQASASMLSGSFSFVEAAKFYLEQTKNDMYEIMDQPRPEDVKTVPSGKALRFLFYDLMARCDEKWLNWTPAVLWAIRYMLAVTKQFKLYKEAPGINAVELQAKISITPEYPIPDDVEVQKQLALQEVVAEVRSKKSYIEEFSLNEDAEAEFNRILEEKRAIDESVMPFPTA